MANLIVIEVRSRNNHNVIEEEMYPTLRIHLFFRNHIVSIDFRSRKTASNG